MSITSAMSFERQVKTLQIIRASLILGVTVFLLIVLFAISGMPEKSEFGVLEIVLTFLIVNSIAVYFLAPKFVKIDAGSRDALKTMTSSEKDVALMNYVTQTEIIRGAVLEGPTFLAFILIIIGSSKIGLFLGLMLIAVTIAVFPVTSRIRSRIETMKFEMGL